MTPTRISVPAGATAVVVDFETLPVSPPVTPPSPPAPAESAIGTTLAVNTAAPAKIIGQDLATYTLARRPNAASSADYGLFRNGAYLTGADVTAVTYEGNNTFLETTTRHGAWRKVVSGASWVTTFVPAVSPTPSPRSPPNPTTPPPVGAPDAVDPTVIPPLPAGYVQTFLDEFSGNALDVSKWTANTMTGPDSYGDRPIFDPSNVVVRNGLLHFKVDRFNNRARSGGVFTKEKFTQRFGLFEACYSYGSASDGDFSSFWLTPWPNLRSWPDFGEIDINEGSNFDMLTSIHQRDLNPQYPAGDGRRNLSNKGTRLAADPSKVFNVFAVEWTPDYIRWLLNGVEGDRQDRGAGFFGKYPWVEPRQMLLQRFILQAGDPGSDWGGSIPSNFDMSSTAKIAWVRVSQKV